jgi:thiol-disulfide isomerase/thioredoxin
MNSNLFDKRADFFKGFFEQSLKYKDFIETGTPEQKNRWLNIENSLTLSENHQLLLTTFTRTINVLVLAGIWCGDCSRQGPMLKLIADKANTIDLRFIDNQKFPDLRDELRICGGTRVPVVVALSEDFFEVARFGDRHLSIYRKKALNEFGATCEAGVLTPPKNELETELSEWVNHFERIHLILRLSPLLRGRYKD